jgi:hypothetical protein
MMYLQKSFTVPAAPEKITACEACVYGRGHHAPTGPTSPITHFSPATPRDGLGHICK